MVTDIKGLAPGVARTFDAAGNTLLELDFGRLTYADEPITPDELADRQYVTARHVVRTLLDGVDSAHLLLSGGYDSRLLAALTAGRHGIQLRVSTLATRAYETPLAEGVAATLRLPLDVVPSRPRITDLFKLPFAPTPAGFVCGMNLTNHMETLHPGLPTLSGLMGDGTMRVSVLPGSTDFAQERASLTSAELAAKVEARFTLPEHRLNLLHGRTRDAVRERASTAIRRFVEIACAIGKPLI